MRFHLRLAFSLGHQSRPSGMSLNLYLRCIYGRGKDSGADQSWEVLMQQPDRIEQKSLLSAEKDVHAGENPPNRQNRWVYEPRSLVNRSAGHAAGSL